MRGKSYELCGPLAQSTIERLNIGTMFIGIDGISVADGVTTYSELEAEIGRMLISRSKQVVAVFDSSKAGRTSLFSFADCSSLHACVTDGPMDSTLEDHLRQHGVDIHYAEQEQS